MGSRRKELQEALRALQRPFPFEVRAIQSTFTPLEFQKRVRDALAELVYGGYEIQFTDNVGDKYVIVGVANQDTFRDMVREWREKVTCTERRELREYARRCGTKLPRWAK